MYSTYCIRFIIPSALFIEVLLLSGVFYLSSRRFCVAGLCFGRFYCWNICPPNARVFSTGIKWKPLIYFGVCVCVCTSILTLTVSLMLLFFVVSWNCVLIQLWRLIALFIFKRRTLTFSYTRVIYTCTEEWNALLDEFTLFTLRVQRRLYDYLAHQASSRPWSIRSKLSVQVWLKDQVWIWICYSRTWCETQSDFDGQFWNLI